MTRGITRRRYLHALLAAAASAAVCRAERPLVPVKARLPANLTSVPVRAIPIHAGADMQSPVVVTSLAVDPAGQWLAVAGDDHSIRLFELSTLVETHVLEGHRDLIRSLAFGPEGRLLASAGNDGQLMLWDCRETFRPIQKMSTVPALACVRFSTQGTELAAVGFDKRVFLSGKQNRPNVRCDSRDLRSVAYRDDDALLAAGGHAGRLHLIDPQIGENLGSYPVHRGRVQAIVFQRDSNLAVTVGDDGHVVIFDTKARTVLRRIAVTTGCLFAVARLDSQRVAVAGSDNAIRIVNIDEGTIEHRLEGHQGSIASLACFGGHLFSGSFDATLRRWSVGDLSKSRQRIAEADPAIDR